jgi:NADPH:quinone reductase-like Zn-dependent oxidoreductase
VIVIGVGSGATINLNLFQLMGARARIGGSTLRARTRSEKADVAAGVTAHVLPLLERGTISVPVCSTFPMAEVNAAYERFGAGGKLGKVVLVN